MTVSQSLAATSPSNELNGGSGMNAPDPSRPVPEVGALLMDVTRDQVGKFRGEWAGRWALRPVKGGVEWDVEPGDVRPVTAEQRLRAEVGKANARSRGEIA
ncbi:hypothetical protein [Streptomyces acidiscabies]|nr:hypothetical protein [Streptomyces acidiscabies]GAQ53864.1 hypothetical protein a10_03669 [Streptomyces acidiscabies]GAV45554.1 hypothetical protein Saa2_08545 [Streptomyces acidiscabies]